MKSYILRRNDSIVLPVPPLSAMEECELETCDFIWARCGECECKMNEETGKSLNLQSSRTSGKNREWKMEIAKYLNRSCFHFGIGVGE